MALKFKIDKTAYDGLDEAIKALYAERDGSYFLSVDGAVASDKLDEFRNTNVDLMKKLEAFKDVDPEQYRALLEDKKKRDGKKTITVDDLDKLVADKTDERVAEMKKKYEKENADLIEANTRMGSQLSELLIDNTVRSAAITHGVAKTAYDDLVGRAQRVFRVVDGKAVAYNGEKQMFDADGSTPLPVSKWVENLKETAPHLFTSNSGGGAGGAGNGKPGEQAKSPVAKIAAGLSAGQ